MILRARRLYASESFGVKLEQTVYALDSTTIDLCLSLLPWARFRSTKAAVKLHPLLDLRGPIPTMISISEGKKADLTVLDDLILEPGAFYVMDRGYVDFARLYHFVLAGAFFVSIEHYPDRLRRISYRDPESGKAFVFLTNNFDLPALTIAQFYKSRWQVELFFK